MMEESPKFVIKKAGDYSNEVSVENGVSRHLITEKDGGGFVVKDFEIGLGDLFKGYSNDAGVSELLEVTSGKVSFAVSGEVPQILEKGDTVSIPEDGTFDLKGIKEGTILRCVYTKKKKDLISRFKQLIKRSVAA